MLADDKLSTSEIVAIVSSLAAERMKTKVGARPLVELWTEGVGTGCGSASPRPLRSMIFWRQDGHHAYRYMADGLTYAIYGLPEKARGQCSHHLWLLAVRASTSFTIRHTVLLTPNPTVPCPQAFKVAILLLGALSFVLLGSVCSLSWTVAATARGATQQVR